MTVIGLNKIYREEKAKIEAFESGENPLNAHDISEIKVKLASTLEKMNQLAKRDIQAPMAFALAIPSIPKLIGRCDVLLSRIPSDTPIIFSSEHVAESSTPAPSSEFSAADYTPSKVYAKATKQLQGPRNRINRFDSVAKHQAEFNARKGAAPELKPASTPVIESSSIAASSQPIPLPTLITIQYPARFGEHLYIRGEGSGFTWGQKVPLISVDANTWQLRQPMQGEFKFKILLNNEEWETGNDHPANGGDAVSATPVFASQAEKSAEASSLTRVSFFYQPADGETLEVRDSLHDWSAGIELKDMGNGMWVWETDKAAGEFDFKLVRRQGSGEIIWEGGDNRKMQPGTIELIEPRF
ncbi:MAG: hypothetical protein KF898_06495 [Parachlamydiales bacterium]|nr:hypothetical protein [Candidatus Acheromyda pituitae]